MESIEIIFNIFFFFLSLITVLFGLGLIFQVFPPDIVSRLFIVLGGLMFITMGGYGILKTSLSLYEGIMEYINGNE